MSQSLHQFLSNGSLIDNTVHSVNEEGFRAGFQKEPLPIWHASRGFSRTEHVWPLLKKAHRLELNPSNLVLLDPTSDYTHNSDDRFARVDGFSPKNFSISTGNVIGCLKDGDYHLRISSRFGDQFLRFIISDADGFIEVPDSGGTDDGSYDWLLVHLWLVKLKKALRLGLPKSYESRTEVVPRARGVIDPVHYALNQRRGVYSCSYREHSYDNPTTRLISRTLDHLDSTSRLTSGHTLRQTFLTATEGRRHPLQKLLATPPLNNPYFADFNPVIEMAKRILRDELLDFGSQDDTSAFFFDVSMLFENFVRNIVKRAGFRLLDNTDLRWSIPTGLPQARRKLIPDLVFENEGHHFVFDVKYKRFNFGGPSPGVKREDLFQMHTYVAHARNHFKVSGCGFIYPIPESVWLSQNLDRCGGIITSSLQQAGEDIPFHIVFVRIPETSPSQEPSQTTSFHQEFSLNLEMLQKNLEEALLAAKDQALSAPSH